MPRRVEYIVSVKPTHSIRVHPWPKNLTSKADRTPKKTSDLATDGHGYTRMRSAGFLALDTYLSPVDERNASSDAPGAERRCLGNISQSCVQDCATVSSGGNLVL